jgi:hypothetical protein
METTVYSAAAEIAFREAGQAARGGLGALLSDLGVLAVDAMARPTPQDAQAARIAAARFVQPIADLSNLTRRAQPARILAVEAGMIRIDPAAWVGHALADRNLLLDALTEANTALDALRTDHGPSPSAGSCRP